MRTLYVLAALGLASPALADAIDGPPSCPPGARGDSGHEGQWCVPFPCTAATDCEGGVCAEWRVCTRAASVRPGGRGGDDGPMLTIVQAVETCAPNESCDGSAAPPVSVGTFEGPATCTTAMYCVPRTSAPLPSRAPEQRASSGCSAAPGGAISGAYLIGLALALRRKR